MQVSFIDTPTPAQLGIMEAIHAMCLGKDTEFPPKLMQSYWLVSDDETHVPVAYASATINLAPTLEVFLSRCCVLPHARGRRIQGRLITARLWWAHQQGARRAVTYTLVENVASMRNLIRAGFRPYWPDPVWCTDDVVYWERDWS